MTNEGKQQSVLLLTGCSAFIRAVGTCAEGQLLPRVLTVLEAKPKDLVLVHAPPWFQTFRRLWAEAQATTHGDWQGVGRSIKEKIRFYYVATPRTTDTQWRNKSKKSENLGRCGRQNMLRPYLKIWEWEWIFGRSVKAISSPGVRSPWITL